MFLPKKTFKKLTDYLKINLKFEIDTEKIDKIIELNSFENLKKIELSKGFKEAAINENNKIHYIYATLIFISILGFVINHCKKQKSNILNIFADILLLNK